MADGVSSLVSGIKARVYTRGATLGTDPSDQYVIPVEDKIISCRARAGTFRIPGIAGTTPQRLLQIFNAAGSTVIVDVDGIYFDVMQTAAKVVEPPVLRVNKVTTALTGGSAMVKVPDDSTMASNASVTLLQGATAENTASNLAGTLTPATNIITQEWVARALTMVGYEQFDRIGFFEDTNVALRAGEGLVMSLDYSVATANPVTDKYVCTVKWKEYTRP